MTETQQQEWTNVIESDHSLFKLNLKEVWQYRDLVFMFVKRDFISSFKQTILGPLWFFINPIMTTIVFTFVFGGIAKLPTDGIPPVLFYLPGQPCSDAGRCIRTTSRDVPSSSRWLRETSRNPKRR